MDEEQASKPNRLKRWGKANFWFSLIILLLGMLAALSLAYGFMRGNNTPVSTVAANDMVSTGVTYLPELSLLPDQSGDGQSDGSTLGTTDGQLPCQAAERARVLVPIVQAANDEYKRHQQYLKQLDYEKSLTKLLDSYGVRKETNRHAAVLEELARQEAAALAAIGC